MTVSTLITKNQYTGNGATTIFAYAFKINADADIVVTLKNIASGATTVLTLSTNYTVSGAGDAAGGNVTLLDLSATVVGEAILPSTYTVTVSRSVTINQDTDLSSQGGFNEETHENVFDKEIMIAQELQEQLDRCVKVDITSETDPDDLLDDVNDAVVAAEAAQAGAETAETNAETAQTNAETAQTNAETAETNAETAQAAAEAAQAALGLPTLTGKAGQGLKINVGEDGYDAINNVPPVLAVGSAYKLIRQNSLGTAYEMKHLWELDAPISKNADYAITNTDNIKNMHVTTGSSNNVEITLPDATANAGRQLNITKVDTGTKFVEIERAGSDTVRGSATSIYAIAQYETISVVAVGTDWVLVSCATRTVTAKINGSLSTPTATNLLGGTWITSVTDSGAGIYTLTVPTGVFLSAPNGSACYSPGNSNAKVAWVLVSSTTSIATYIYSHTGSGLDDADLIVTVHGLK